MSASRLRALHAVGTLVLTACSSGGIEGATRSEADEIVYGPDDRIELGESPLRGAVAPVALALIPFERLGDPSAQPSAGVLHGWCEGERFYDQPALAVCSAVAVAPDLVLTAAHCVPDQARCHALAFVRSYWLEKTDAEYVPEPTEVHACAELVLSVKSSVLDPETYDYALVRLTTPLPALASRPVRVASPVTGQSVTVVGASSGLPLKGSAGTVLRDGDALPSFDFTADVFSGNSGSGVFAVDGSLVGIHVSGGVDHTREPSGCLTARSLPDDGSETERANAILPVLADLCTRRPDEVLCESDVGSSGSGVPVPTSLTANAGAGCTVRRALPTPDRPWGVVLGLAALAAVARRRAVSVRLRASAEGSSRCR